MREEMICCAMLVGGWAGPFRRNSVTQAIRINRKSNAILVIGIVTAP